jgi:hypothetical protein
MPAASTDGTPTRAGIRPLTPGRAQTNDMGPSTGVSVLAGHVPLAQASMPSDLREGQMHVHSPVLYRPQSSVQMHLRSQGEQRTVGRG